MATSDPSAPKESTAKRPAVFRPVYVAIFAVVAVIVTVNHLSESATPATVTQARPDSTVAPHPQPEVARTAEERVASIEAAATSLCSSSQSARVKRLVAQHDEWDDQVIATIACRRFGMGMTAAQLRASLGAPNDVNRTVTRYGTHEQWIYGEPISGATYIYLEDGIITSWQN